MEPKESATIQIIPNKFHNIDSEFTPQIPLNTNAKQASPFYAMFTLVSDEEGKKFAAIKTFQGITLVEFENTEFKNHHKLFYDDIPVDQAHITTLTFRREVYTPTNPAHLILGYRSGLVAWVDMGKKILGLYNHDEKNRPGYAHKAQSVSLIATVPESNGEEILVLFSDSSVIKYQLNAKANNSEFIEKLKRFEQKISFKENLNQFNHRQKTKNNIRYGKESKDSAPEFNLFYAYNDNYPVTNPIGYYRFNHRTMTDMVLKKHESFTKTILRDTKPKDAMVLAFVSLDGYLIIYSYPQMSPRLSYKSTFGGINSVSFSEDCELIALGGQDDCITVLDLCSMKTLRCEGHKSFISRAIFQTIPFKKLKDETAKQRISRENSQERNESSGLENRCVRMIGGGMDACLSFWEFEKTELRATRPTIAMEEKNMPVRLSQRNVEIGVMKPIVSAQTKDAIAWMEISENMLFITDYDGSVGIYNIGNLSNKDAELVMKARKTSDGVGEMRNSGYLKSGNSTTTMQRENSHTSSREEQYGNYKGNREEGNGREYGRTNAPYSSLTSAVKEREKEQGKDILSRKKREY